MPLDVPKTAQTFAMRVELELQLVSLSDFDLVPAFPDMLALLGRAPYGRGITLKGGQGKIEIDSGAHAGYATCCPVCARCAIRCCAPATG